MEIEDLGVYVFLEGGGRGAGKKRLRGTETETVRQETHNQNL
jgi:hypothetical protein